jgi:hypothetical protein
MSTPVLVQAAPGGGCCDCATQVGCDCGLVCRLFYQVKAGSATLCGFSENTGYKSSPPKKYLNDAKSGTVYKGTWPVAGCPSSPPDGQVYTWTTSETNLNMCDAYGCLTASLAQTVSMKMSGGSKCIRVQATIVVALTTGHDPSAVSWSVNLVKADGTTEVNVINKAPGAAGTFNYDSGWITGFPTNWVGALYRFYCGDGFFSHNSNRWRYATAPFLTSGTLDSFRDVWSFNGQYSLTPIVCSLSATDTSARFDEQFGAYPLTTGGTAVGAPSESDYTGLVTTTLTAITRTVSGSGCTAVGGGVYAQVSGGLTETLTQEDTEDAAVERAKALITKWTRCAPVSPADCSAYKTLRGAGVFTLSFRASEYAIDESGLIANKAYVATVKIQRRLAGTANPFVDYSIDYISFTAQPIGPATWHDITTDSGWETAAVSCTIALNE